MQRHMHNTQDMIPSLNADSKGESSSSRSSQLPSDTPLSDSFDLDGIKFSQIPAMSMDGLEDYKNEDGRRTNQTAETEEEEAVLDRGQDYKLSIMRKKRPLVVDEDEKRAEPTSPLQFPKFGQEESKDDECPLDHLDGERESRRSNTEIVTRGSNNTIFLRQKYMQKLSQNRMIDPTGTRKPK